MVCNFGSVPMVCNFGSVPMVCNVGSVPMVCNFGSVPMLNKKAKLQSTCTYLNLPFWLIKL
jgi:hypothetical protein